MNHQKALNLLNALLNASQPGSTIEISSSQARLLAELGHKDLGNLAVAMEVHGVNEALKKVGLFGRRVRIADS